MYICFLKEFFKPDTGDNNANFDAISLSYQANVPTLTRCNF